MASVMDVIKGLSQAAANVYDGALDENGNYAGYQFYSNQQWPDGHPQAGQNQIIIYDDSEEGIFLKASEILDNGSVPTNNYILQFDFLRNVFSNFNGSVDPRFYINEIDYTVELV